MARRDSRAALVDAAAALFAQQSYAETSVQDVCEAAGVTKGSFYYHFRSKEEVLYEIYARMFRVQLSDLEEVSSSDAAVIEKLRAVADGVVRSSIEHLHEATVFWQSLPNVSEGMRTRLRAQRREYHERIKALIEQGQAERTLRTDLPADIMVNFFYGAVHRLDDWYRHGGAYDGAQVGQAYAELFVSSVTCRTSTRTSPAAQA